MLEMQREASLNKAHRFKGEVDGTSIHFIHERGEGPEAVSDPAQGFFDMNRWTQMP